MNNKPIFKTLLPLKQRLDICSTIQLWYQQRPIYASDWRGQSQAALSDPQALMHEVVSSVYFNGYRQQILILEQKLKEQAQQLGLSQRNIEELTYIEAQFISAIIPDLNEPESTHPPYIAYLLASQGKYYLELIATQLISNQITPNIKLNALQELTSASQLAVCGPGLYTHLQNTCDKLATSPTNTLATVRQQLAQQLASSFIQHQSDLEVAEENQIHWVNALVNNIAENYALQCVEDQFSPPNLPEALQAEFNAYYYHHLHSSSFFQALEHKLQEQFPYLNQANASGLVNCLDHLGNDPHFKFELLHEPNTAQWKSSPRELRITLLQRLWQQGWLVNPDHYPLQHDVHCYAYQNEPELMWVIEQTVTSIYNPYQQSYYHLEDENRYLLQDWIVKQLNDKSSFNELLPALPEALQQALDNQALFNISHALSPQAAHNLFIKDEDEELNSRERQIKSNLAVFAMINHPQHLAEQDANQLSYVIKRQYDPIAAINDAIQLGLIQGYGFTSLITQYPPCQFLLQYSGELKEMLIRLNKQEQLALIDALASSRIIPHEARGGTAETKLDQICLTVPCLWEVTALVDDPISSAQHLISQLSTAHVNAMFQEVKTIRLSLGLFNAHLKTALYNKLNSHLLKQIIDHFDGVKEIISSLTSQHATQLLHEMGMARLHDLLSEGHAQHSDLLRMITLLNEDDQHELLSYFTLDDYQNLLANKQQLINTVRYLPHSLVQTIVTSLSASHVKQLLPDTASLCHMIDILTLGKRANAENLIQSLSQNGLTDIVHAEDLGTVLHYSIERLNPFIKQLLTPTLMNQIENQLDSTDDLVRLLNHWPFYSYAMLTHLGTAKIRTIINQASTLGHVLSQLASKSASNLMAYIPEDTLKELLTSPKQVAELFRPLTPIAQLDTAILLDQKLDLNDHNSSFQVFLKLLTHHQVDELLSQLQPSCHLADYLLTQLNGQHGHLNQLLVHADSHSSPLNHFSNSHGNLVSTWFRHYRSTFYLLDYQALIGPLAHNATTHYLQRQIIKLFLLKCVLYYDELTHSQPTSPNTASTNSNTALTQSNNAFFMQPSSPNPHIMQQLIAIMQSIKDMPDIMSFCSQLNHSRLGQDKTSANSLECQLLQFIKTEFENELYPVLSALYQFAPTHHTRLAMN